MNKPRIPATAAVDTLYDGIRQLVERARSQVLTQVNQALVLTYWHIGKTIKMEILQHERAQYGAAVLKQLAERLSRDYGSGFSHSGLTRMAKFYDCLPEEPIVATLSQQLSWSHFVELIKAEETRLLHRHVRAIALVGAHPARAHGQHVVRAHSHRQTTRAGDSPGTGPTSTDQ